MRGLTQDELLTLAAERCALLCSKEEDLTAALLAPPRERFAPDPYVWCARTLTAQGPDGEEVHVVDCQPARACWQARARRGS